MEGRYPITLEQARRNIGIRHLNQLSNLPMKKAPDGEKVPKEEKESYQNLLEQWSGDNKDTINYAVKQKAFGGRPGMPINWSYAFLAFMESASVYLRDSDKVVEAVELHHAGQFEDALNKLNESVENIQKVANLWGMDFQLLCDLLDETPKGHWFGDGPYCGAFYSRNPTAPFIGIAFKGTNVKSLGDLFTDLNYGPTQGSADMVYGSHVSKGVYTGLFGEFKSGKAFELITEGLHKILLTMPNDKGGQVVTHVTGHSLGGSYSSVCFTQYTEEEQLPPLAMLGDLYTFGSPRNGEQDFAVAIRDHLSKWTGSSWRMVNEEDPVPTVPPVWPDSSVFIHVDAGYGISANKAPHKLDSEIDTTPPGKDPHSGFDNHKIEHYYNAMVKALQN